KGADSRLHLQRVIVGVARIRQQRSAVELWIGFDEVFRKSVVPQYGALFIPGDVGQRSVTRSRLAVVQCVERSRERLIIAVCEIVSDIARRGCSKVHRWRLEHSLDRRSDWPARNGRYLRGRDPR